MGILGGLALVLVALAAAAPAEANWSPAVNLSAAQGEGAYPSVAMAPDGSTTVAWQALETSDEIMVSTRPAGTGSSFSTPVRISAPPSYAPTPLGGDGGGPEVAIDSTGRTTVVWTQAPPPQIDGGLTVWAATRPAGSSTFSAPVALSDSGFDQGAFYNSRDPQIAVDPTGRTTVVWSFVGADQTPEILASTRPANSDVFSAPVDISQFGTANSYGLQPQLAAGPDGRTTVIWESYDGVSGQTSVRASTRAGGSITFSAPEQVSTGAGGINGAKVAIGPDGRTTVVYAAVFCIPSTGDCTEVLEARTRPAGSSTFAPKVNLVPGLRDPYVRYPQIAVGSDGRTTVVWEEGISAGIYGSTRPAGSDTFGGREKISTTTQRSGYPQVAIEPGQNGRTTVAWVDYLTNTDVNGYSVVAAVRPKGATTFQAPAFLQQAGSSALVDVAAGPCNGFSTVVWQNSPNLPNSPYWISWVEQSSNPTGNCLFPRPRFSFKFLGPELAKLARAARLTFQLKNTGDATANEISLRVTGGGIDARQSAGSLGAGKTKTVEVPGKFKKAGKVQITARVTAANAEPVTTKANIRVAK